VFLFSLIRDALQRQGRDFIRYPLKHYLDTFKIDCVLDVGANVGQYAMHIRSLGYRGRIESFEPLGSASEKLRLKANQHGAGKWKVHNYALGSAPATDTINVSTHSAASSFRKLSAIEHAIDLTTVGHETVTIVRLDSIYSELCASSDNVCLKIDTQGFEMQVLEGAGTRLSEIKLIQLEASLVPQYMGESLIEDLIAYLRSRSFVPIWIINGYTAKPSFQLYQADVIFVRSDLL
jgi:FkbM family methyltransferase